MVLLEDIWEFKVWPRVVARRVTRTLDTGQIPSPRPPNPGQTKSMVVKFLLIVLQHFIEFVLLYHLLKIAGIIC